MTKTNYISIKPEGFVINGNIEKSITFKIIKEKWARKLWSVASGRRFLACFSSNGIKARDGKDCSKCFDREACLLKKRIFFEMDQVLFCLELPSTSYKNYMDYIMKLNSSGIQVKTSTTIAHIINRKYWGEVWFSLKSK